MAELEDDLKQWLARRDPSDAFTEKVMGRVRNQGRRRPPVLARWVIAGSIAASLVMGGYFWREQERADRARGMKARDELVQALEITSAKLEKARAIVLQSLKEKSL